MEERRSINAFFCLDPVAVWRTVNRFNAQVGFRDILPVRACACIPSILNEQVGKEAMARWHSSPLSSATSVAPD